MLPGDARVVLDLGVILGRRLSRRDLLLLGPGRANTVARLSEALCAIGVLAGQCTANAAS